MKKFDLFIKSEIDYPVYNSDEIIKCRPIWFVPVHLRDKATGKKAEAWCSITETKYIGPSFAVKQNTSKIPFGLLFEQDINDPRIKPEHWIYTKKPGTILRDEDNIPLSLRVVKFEKRGEGGIALKVVDQRGYLFDMREPEFMKAVMEGRVKRGGHIHGKYLLGGKGANVKPVLCELPPDYDYIERTLTCQ